VTLAQLAAALGVPLREVEKGLEAASRLSRAALETLAIVAYQQPVTRPEIDAIRGVNSDGVLKSLLSKGLVQEVGRAERPGRPILYSTTTDFLGYFGLSSLEELPPLSTDNVDQAQQEPEEPDVISTGLFDTLGGWGRLDKLHCQSVLPGERSGSG
jgi:segregation and condensation protein B